MRLPWIYTTFPDSGPYFRSPNRPGPKTQPLEFIYYRDDADEEELARLNHLDDPENRVALFHFGTPAIYEDGRCCWIDDTNSACSSGIRVDSFVEDSWHVALLTTDGDVYYKAFDEPIDKLPIRMTRLLDVGYEFVCGLASESGNRITMWQEKSGNGKLEWIQAHEREFSEFIVNPIADHEKPYTVNATVWYKFVSHCNCTLFVSGIGQPIIIRGDEQVEPDDWSDSNQIIDIWDSMILVQTDAGANSPCSSGTYDVYEFDDDGYLELLISDVYYDRPITRKRAV